MGLHTADALVVDIALRALTSDDNVNSIEELPFKKS